MKKHTIILVLAIAFSFNLNAQNKNIKYKTYCNLSYKFCTDYPDGILIPQGEPDSQDGQAFLSKNKKNELLVFRQFIDFGNDDNELTLKYQFDKQIKKSKNKITYKKLSQNFFVISGYNTTGQIFYQKTYLFDKDLFTCILTYNATEKELYNTIAEHVFKSFKS